MVVVVIVVAAGINDADAADDNEMAILSAVVVVTVDRVRSLLGLGGAGPPSATAGEAAPVLGVGVVQIGGGAAKLASNSATLLAAASRRIGDDDPPPEDVNVVMNEEEDAMMFGLAWLGFGGILTIISTRINDISRSHVHSVSKPAQQKMSLIILVLLPSRYFPATLPLECTPT